MNRPYPAVRFVVQHGPRLALGVPVVIFLAGLLGLAFGFGLWLPIGAAITALITFCVLRVFVELVQIIAETLLPQ
ncbi:hypothetical protein [Microvirga massiliensis]|uniref:hypothetical protein n=1 Tax=Microvirga massiliensis TaxID=1033741 RepID=UPI00062B8DF7|nr:hypothetical protein [Microvirga massiliensis]